MIENKNTTTVLEYILSHIKSRKIIFHVGYPL